MEIRIPVQRGNSIDYIKLCRFKVGDKVKLIEPLEVWYDKNKEPEIFPAGTMLTIGAIRIRVKNPPIDAVKSGEIYVYTLVDDDDIQLAEVGQYMFDITVAEEHKRRIGDLKKTCIEYKFIIASVAIIKIMLLITGIITVILGMVNFMLSRVQGEFDSRYALIAMILFIAFIILALLENIKYPKGLERELMNKARLQAKLVYCIYDYYKMDIID